MWGGGQFENDVFYELCDEAGLLIWHDLLFACAFYPADPAFLESVEMELRDNIRRLRIHPSIVMWNGNNEVEIGWKEWGWQNNHTKAELTEMWSWYQALFLGRIPKVLAEVNPDTFYYPTSPTSSFGNDERFKGDIHYWGVWAGWEDIERYDIIVGRINSEYGMQAMPDFSSIRKFTNGPDDWSIDSEIMQIHERHPNGWPSIKHYIDKYFQPPKDFQSYVHATQALQYYSLETAITALRAAKPYNMGSIYWQINDVWPVSSWATVDFYGCWKAAHYAARLFHSDPLVVAKVVNGTEKVKLFLITDTPYTVKGKATITWMTLGG